MSRLCRTVAIGALFAFVACDRSARTAPADIAIQLYVTLEVSGVRSVPEARALLALEPYLTPSLVAQLRRAQQRRDSAAAASPDEKPPYADGDPFSSLFEGWSTNFVKSTTMRGDTAYVLMAFTNTEQKPHVSWSDTLVLVKPAARWQLADIRYGAGWEFGYRGRLSAVLPPP